MTTIRKIIESIDLEKHGREIHGNTNLCSIFDINEYITFDDRIKMVFIRPHFCTGSWVGIRAYFLDGEFVAVSEQIGRSWDEQFEFASNEAAIKVKDYIMSFVIEQECVYNIANTLDYEIDDFYTLKYAGQILHSHGIYRGERVAIKHNNKTRPNKKYEDFNTITIIMNDKEHDVNCREILLSYVDIL